MWAGRSLFSSTQEMKHVEYSTHFNPCLYLSQEGNLDIALGVRVHFLLLLYLEEQMVFQVFATRTCWGIQPTCFTQQNNKCFNITTLYKQLKYTNSHAIVLPLLIFETRINENMLVNTEVHTTVGKETYFFKDLSTGAVAVRGIRTESNFTVLLKSAGSNLFMELLDEMRWD